MRRNSFGSAEAPPSRKNIRYSPFAAILTGACPSMISLRRFLGKEDAVPSTSKFSFQIG
jgi:hypothetical protein